MFGIRKKMQPLDQIKIKHDKRAKKRLEKELNKNAILKEKSYNYYIKNLYKIITKKIQNGDYLFHLGGINLPYCTDNMIPQLEGLWNAMCELALCFPTIFEGLYMRKDWLIKEEDKYDWHLSRDFIIKFVYAPGFENKPIIFTIDKNLNEQFQEVRLCQKI